MVVSQCGFILHLLNDQPCSYLLMCFSGVTVFSLVKCLFKSFSCFFFVVVVGCFIFFLLGFEGSLYILDTSPLLGMLYTIYAPSI